MADNQRRASSGNGINTLDEMIPADVLVKYPFLKVSPDKTWNHVDLYLGRDKQDIQWLIELTSKTGVRLSMVETFDPKGGIKRFTLTSRPFNSLAARHAHAPLVPKFGRLVVRQYHKLSPDRPVHRGLDLYVPERTPVYATIAGLASHVSESVEGMKGIEIASSNMKVRYLMLDGITIESGVGVNIGELLGYVAVPSEMSDIAYFSLNEQMTHTHLHLEVEMGTEDNVPTEIVADGKRYTNHLYLTKIGKLPLPLQL